MILTESSGRLSDLQAPVSFDGGSELDFLQMWDDLMPVISADVYTFGAGTLERNTFPQVSFAQVEDFDLRVGPGTNTIILNSIAPAPTNFDFYGGGEMTHLSSP